MVTQVTGHYADIYAWENLYAAYRKAVKGKRGRATTAAFEYHLEDNLIQLQDELAAETYRPGPYQHFTIHEPKRRLISAAPFPNRVVHHALCNIIEPAFERSFIYHSYANRIGKGTHHLTACSSGARGSTTGASCRVCSMAMFRVKYRRRSLASRYSVGSTTCATATRGGYVWRC